MGFEWASKVTTIALSFSLPAVIGFGIDRWSGSSPIATLIGVVLGFVVGLMQILRLSSEISGPKARSSRSPSDVKEGRPDRSADERNRPGAGQHGS
jgi:ATP synthase protein I